MRYLCLIGFSYAAATMCSAYWLPQSWLLPLAAALLALGLAALLLHHRHPHRALLRVLLCALSAALALGAYALHLRTSVAPARALHGTVTTASVELRESPRVSAYGFAALAYLQLNGSEYSVQCYLDEAADLRPGDVLTGTFELELPSEETENQQEPGYLRSCGVYLTVNPQGSFTTQRPAHLPLRHWPAMLRTRITEACRQAFDEDTAPWFIALLTNQNEHFTFTEKNNLKLAGLYHCMCTSGMHIHVLLGLVTLLCLQNRRLAAWIGLPVCLFFWAVAGGTPSVSRAVVMQALLLLAPLLHQEHDTPTALAFALLLTLIRQPDSIAHLGLQLSYLSVAGIALFAQPLYQWGMARRPIIWLQRIPVADRLTQAVLSSLSTSLGAVLLTSPLLAWRYGVVSLFAPLSGLFVIPLVTLCFSLGLPLTLLVVLFPALRVLALPLNWVMRGIAALTQLFTEFPVLYVNSPYWIVWMVLCYLLLLLLWIGKPRVWTVMLCLALSFALTLGLQQWELHRNRAAFRVTALDVGQGQCLIVEYGAKVCVIDCGGSYPEQAGEDCARWLLQHGYDHIDLLALTHFHADHAGGALQLLSRIDTETVLLPDVPDKTGTRSAIEASAAHIQWITEDRVLPIGDGSLTAYAPRSEAGDNEACVAYLASCMDCDLLVTGDMDRTTEILLCKTADLPDLELLAAGHHGSRDANSETLLSLTRPECVLVSSSDRYGHPHAEALERFAAVGAAVLCTDEMGTIIIER